MSTRTTATAHSFENRLQRQKLHEKAYSLFRLDRQSSIHPDSFRLKKKICPHTHQKREGVERPDLLSGPRCRVLEVHEHLICNFELFFASLID